MTTYVEHLNARLVEAVARHDSFVAFGQNIDAGSRLSGLTRGLPCHGRHRVINTPNVENTLVGVGFGLMLRGLAGAFVMKQLDFLLLGVDQIVNTWNVLREQRPTGSFTILAIVVDGGYAGPQSSFNGLYDLCAIARVPGFTVTNRFDIDAVMARHFGAPGFRIITVSERLFRTPLIDWSVGAPVVHGEGEITRYAAGPAATIACCNLSFPKGVALAGALGDRGLTPSVFSINAAHPVDCRPIVDDLRTTGRLVLLDDSKSWNPPYADLLAAAREICGPDRVHLIARGAGVLRPNADEFVVPNDWLCRVIAGEPSARAAGY